MFGLTPFRRNLAVRRADDFDHRTMFPRLFREFFDGFDGGQFRVDIKDNQSEYVLEAELPGISKEQISLDVDQDHLTISVESNDAYEQENGDYVHRERRTQRCQRSFHLNGIKAEEIKASYKDGILKVSLPKDPSQQTHRQIAIE